MFKSSLSGFNKTAELQFTRVWLLSNNLTESISQSAGSVTRASAAVVIGDDGSVTDLASNEGKFTGNGILVENAHENIVEYSRDLRFTGTNWESSSSPSTVTVSQATDHQGNTSWCQVDFSGDSQGSIQYDFSTITVGAELSLTCIAKPLTTDKWIRVGLYTSANTHGQSFTFNMDGAGGLGSAVSTEGSNITVASQSIEALTDGFYKCNVTFTNNTAGASAKPVFSLWSTSTSTTRTTTSESFILSEVSLIESTYELSPVATAGAAASSLADVVTINPSAMPLQNYQVYLEFKPLGLTGSSQYILDTNDGTNGDEVYLDASGVITWKRTANSVSKTLTDITAVAGTTYKILLTQSTSSGMTMEVSGEIPVVDATGTEAFSAALSSTGYIGSLSGSSNFADCLINRHKFTEGTIRSIENMQALGDAVP